MLRYLHIDINSYFAIILQQENPALRGRPLGVVKEAGRTCIIAASKEAKKFGVKTGMRVFEARTLCPHLITIPAEFDFYLSATKKFYEILSAITPDFYPFSLDEGFLDISFMRYQYPDPVALGHQIQEQVHAALGEWVTCNVGISYNKLLAKMAGEISPKGSVTVIDESNRDAILKMVSFDDVCGVGPRLSSKLAALGVTHPYQIRHLSSETLKRQFGPFWSAELRAISLGEDSHVLRLLTEKGVSPALSSASRSVTGFHPCDDEGEIRRILYNLTEEVCFKARRMGMGGRKVWVSLEGSSPKVDPQIRISKHEIRNNNQKFNVPMFKTFEIEDLGFVSNFDIRISDFNYVWFDHRTLKRHINHTDEVFNVLYYQMYQGWRREFPLIRYLVSLSELQPMTGQTRSLFDLGQKQEKVTAAVDELNEKYGLFTVRSGLMVGQKPIRPEVTGYFGDKNYYLGNRAANLE